MLVRVRVSMSLERQAIERREKPVFEQNCMRLLSLATLPFNAKSRRSARLASGSTVLYIGLTMDYGSYAPAGQTNLLSTYAGLHQKFRLGHQSWVQHLPSRVARRNFRRQDTYGKGSEV